MILQQWHLHALFQFTMDGELKISRGWATHFVRPISSVHHNGNVFRKFTNGWTLWHASGPPLWTNPTAPCFSARHSPSTLVFLSSPLWCAASLPPSCWPQETPTSSGLFPLCLQPCGLASILHCHCCCWHLLHFRCQSLCISFPRTWKKGLSDCQCPTFLPSWCWCHCTGTSHTWTGYHCTGLTRILFSGVRTLVLSVLSASWRRCIVTVPPSKTNRKNG